MVISQKWWEGGVDGPEWRYRRSGMRGWIQGVPICPDDPVRRRDVRCRQIGQEMDFFGGKLDGERGGKGEQEFICNHNQQSLGPYQSLPEVGNTPPHNSVRLHILVAGKK